MTLNTEHGYQTFLSANEITVLYGTINALADVTIQIKKGEIHAVIGEHGAGKSTFAKTISGFQAFNSGTIHVHGQSYSSFPLKTAQENGIHIVHQYNPFFEALTVAEYYFLESEKRAPFLFNKKSMNEEIDRYLQELNVTLRASTPIKDLRQSDRIFIDVSKKIKNNPELLILDEALEKMSTDKLGIIVSLLKDLKNIGMASVIITHRVDDILEIADRVTVFKDGRIIYTDEVINIDKFNLIQMTYTNFKDNYASSPDFFKFIKYNDAILQKLPVNLIVVDNEYKIKIVNEQIESYFGLPARTLINLSIMDYFGDIPSLKTLIYRSIEEKRAQAFFQVSIKINNIERVCKVNTLPIMDGNLCIGCIVLLDDITEQEKLRKQLQLKETLSSLGLLAAGVAHEINTPLEIINYLVEEISTRSSDSASKASALSIREEVNNISKIIHNLVDFSGSSLSVQNNIFDLHATLNEMINLIKHGAEKRDIKIHYSNVTVSSFFEGNLTEIRQVFLNLIRNSFEAIKTQGKITIMLALNSSKTFLRISFEDNGTGIREEEMNSIFLPFYSTKNNSSTNHGLGLALSYGIINSHGGRITARNLEPGAQFIIELPYNESIQIHD
jgi:PAS domain S-box-containing protein